MTITSELDIYNHEFGENCKTIPFSCSYTAYFDYLATVLWRVSVRFKRLVSDSSLWTSPSPDLDSANNATSHPLEWVTITAGGDPEKVEFVVQECLNSRIRSFTLHGSVADVYPVLTSPRYAEYINPTTRFPNLKLRGKGDKYFHRREAYELNWDDYDDEELEINEKRNREIWAWAGVPEEVWNV